MRDLESLANTKVRTVAVSKLDKRKNKQRKNLLASSRLYLYLVDGFANRRKEVAYKIAKF